MNDKEVEICVECGSEYFKSKSKIKSLCPECAHILYGYENCKHNFKKEDLSIVFETDNKVSTLNT